MNSQLQQLSIDELKKLLARETRIFINALDNQSIVEELQLTRARIKEITELLEKKIQTKENKSD
jgi:hypothetical protein